MARSLASMCNEVLDDIEADARHLYRECEGLKVRRGTKAYLEQLVIAKRRLRLAMTKLNIEYGS